MHPHAALPVTWTGFVLCTQCWSLDAIYFYCICPELRCAVEHALNSVIIQTEWTCYYSAVPSHHFRLVSLEAHCYRVDEGNWLLAPTRIIIAEQRNCWTMQTIRRFWPQRSSASYKIILFWQRSVWSFVTAEDLHSWNLWQSALFDTCIVLLGVVLKNGLPLISDLLCCIGLF